MSLISPAYIQFLKEHFTLDWRGIHGAPHWARVRANGLLLAEQTGADTMIVEAFAFIHDAERRSDFSDPEHGTRAAQLAAAINDEFFQLTPEQLFRLMEACDGHSQGNTVGDITVLTCWDADRLDLGRVGVKPHPDKLFTIAAKQQTMIQWAYNRSLKT